MSDELDIIAMFEKDFDSEIPEHAEKRDSLKWKYFDLCNNMGSVIGRLMADSNGKIFRRIDNVITGYLPAPTKEDPDNKIHIRFATADNFKGHCELTTEQNKLLLDIEKLFDDHWDHFANDLKFKLHYQHFIFYFFIQYYNSTWNDKEETFSSPKPTICIHRSAKFLDAFKAAVNSNHKARGEKQWLANYASRIEGPTFNMITIDTSRPVTAYEININFNELPGRKIEIRKEDLDSTKDLYTDYINVKVFNQEYYQNLYNELKKYCDGLDLAAGLEDHNPDTTNNNK